MTSIIRTYLLLTLLTTLATSLIWGIDTVFLLSVGLSNAQVFLVNSGYMLGQLLFEVPTGVVADTYGRRVSFLAGCVWLSASTLLYAWLGSIQAEWWWFALASASLGIGFTFFTGATEAWLVDELKQVKAEKAVSSALGRAQSVGGFAMLLGAVSGGMIAQFFGLSLPYMLRAGLLLGSFCAGVWLMKETRQPHTQPESSRSHRQQMTQTLKQAITIVRTQPSVGWLVAAAPFSTVVGFYVFYASQPFLLQLYGDTTAYSIAGITAAMVAISRIVGGWLVTKLPLERYSQATLLAGGVGLTSLSLLVLGTTSSFGIAVGVLFIWGLLFAMIQPIRQTFMNQYIPSQQRATVLSIDSLIGSLGSIAQPLLGMIADRAGYGRSFIAGAGGMVVAIPLTLLAGVKEPKKWQNTTRKVK